MVGNSVALRGRNTGSHAKTHKRNKSYGSHRLIHATPSRGPSLILPL
jgi:hypothetical protein